MFRKQRIIRISLIWILCFSISACSFTGLIFAPDKIPSATKKLTVTTSTDTVTINLGRGNSQVYFVKNRKDTIDPGYTIENVFFKSQDGDTLNGWFLKPKNQKAKITLLHFHGNAGSLLSQYRAISPLVKNGFQVFMFDYSGYGLSQGVANRENILTDALSALDYVKARPDVKGTKLVIYGQSLGGHYATVVGAMRQNDIDGLVVEGAPTSFKAMAEHMIPVLGYLLMKQGYKAKKEIRKYHKPLLVIHSTEDQVVPFSMGKKIFNKANQPKEFYQIDKCHMCGPTYYADSISFKIKSMLDVH